MCIEAPSLEERVKRNQWDSMKDFLTVFRKSIRGEWTWTKNSRCKYINLRVDMRTGKAIIMDRYGKRIDPDTLSFQFGDKAYTKTRDQICAEQKRVLG